MTQREAIERLAKWIGSTCPTTNTVGVRWKYLEMLSEQAAAIIGGYIATNDEYDSRFIPGMATDRVHALIESLEV